jgi:hypothetical protein
MLSPMPPVRKSLDDPRRFIRTLRCRAPLRRPLLPSLLCGVLAGLVIAAAFVCWRMVFADNLREVRHGEVFRSGQMSPSRLGQVLADRQIRTVVNLRGCCSDFPWYVDEARCTHHLNVAQEDVCLSAIRLPSPSELRRLLEVLGRTEYPILLHCRQGVDRTGLAAVIVKLLEPGVSLDGARRQLGLLFGYVPFNGTEQMRRFFDLYEEWLERVKCVHSPALFRHWAERDYCPGQCRGWFEATSDFPKDSTLPAQRVLVLHVRAHNSSVRKWRFRPGSLQGEHARYQVLGGEGVVIFQARAGLLDAIVAPGESIELDIGIPRLAPGLYMLQIDLIDAEQNAFCQFGQDPFTWEFRVAP